MPENRRVVQWQPASRRLPNALEVYCLLFAGGAVWYVPRALNRAANEPAFIGPLRGGTRAFGCLFRGDILGAVVFNPLAVVLALVLVLGVLRWLMVLVLGKRPVAALSPRGRWIAVAVVVLAFAANWAYVLWLAPWR
jgi:hypothetical protein